MDIAQEECQTQLAISQRSLSELSRFKFSERPHLQSKFSGDVAQLENARVEGTLQTGPWQRGNYQARNLTMTGEFADQTLSIRQCELQDDLGGLTASANWRETAGELEFPGARRPDLRDPI